MSVKWHKLGEYIEGYSERCGKDDVQVSGVDINKQFISTHANLEETDISKYYLVPSGYFACNLMHIGRDERLPIALNQTGKDLVVTSAYYVFRIKVGKKAEILEEYLYQYLSRAELDRLTWFFTDSSVRGNLKASRFHDIEIPVPSIEEQRKVVAAWQGLRKMKERNEQLAEPLLALCRSYLQECKKKYPMTEIGPMIRIVDEVNSSGRELPVVGVNFSKEFMPTAANMDGIDTTKYKVMTKGRFVFSGMQTGRDVCIRIALYDSDHDSLMSPAYTTFELKDDCGVLPEYFFAMFRRSEMDRLGWFYSDSSVRSNLDWPRFEMIRIPLPPIEVQQAVVDLYRCANEAKKIAAEADRLSREICPALIQKVARGV